MKLGAEHETGVRRAPGTAPARPALRRAARRAAALDWAVGAAAVVAVAAVQLAFRQGPQPFDPAKYFQTAVDFPDVPADLWTLRIGLVVPVRLAVLAFGPSEASLYAVPFLTGLALAAVVYALVLALASDRVVAALAAVVTALQTDVLLRSSAILPDTLATTTFAAGILALVLGASSGRRRVVAAAVAGALFGWTYLVREFSPVLLPVVVAALALLRYRLRQAALVAGAALATGALELLYGAVRHGDPFVHVRLLVTREDRPAGAGVEVVREELDGVVDTIAVFPRLVLAWSSGWTLLVLAGVFALSLALRFRDRRLWLLGAWALSFWLAMALLGLGSLPSGRWLLNVTSVRYWLPLVSALVMGAFTGVAVLLAGRRLAGRVALAPAAALALAALVLVPGLREFDRCAGRDAWPNDPFGRWYELRGWLATGAGDRFATIATDRDTARLVPAFTSTRFGERLWSGEVEELPPAGAPSADLVLVHKDRLVPADQPRVDELRAGREPVFASGDGALVLLADADTVAGGAAAVPPEWWVVEGRDVSGVERGSCGFRPYRARAPAVATSPGGR